MPIPAIWTTDLQTAYNNVLNAFNAGAAQGNYNALAPIMHNDIVIKKVARRESVVGVGHVLTYLNTQMAPVNPVTNVSAYTLRPAVGSANYATAKLGLAYGTATYQDANTGVQDPGIRVYFCWGFVKDEITGYWMLHNVYAHRVDL